MKKILLVLLTLSLFLSVGALADGWQSGTYTGTAEGRNGPVTVEVVLTDSAIQSVTVTSQNETPGIADAALTDIPAFIVSAQSWDVDVSSGATLTSNAIRNAVKQALIAAGADIEEASAAPKAEGETAEADVVIVGGGLAGTMAAIEFNQNYPDLNVILVEQKASLGGDLGYSGGYIMGFQEDYAAQDSHRVASADDYVSYFKNVFTENQNDGYIPADAQINLTYASNVFANAQDTIDYMFDAGVPFKPSLDFASTNPRSNFYSIPACDESGASSFGFVDALSAKANGGSIDIRMNTKATQLLADGNRVTGIIAEDDASIYTIQAKVVILACGSIADNPEMMETYLPSFVGKIGYSTGGSIGSVIDFTRQFDTPIVGDGALGSLVSNDSTWVSLQSHFMVDENGHRYLNECEDDYRIGDDTMRNTGSAWVICDQAYADAHADELALKLAENDVVVYDTLDALAEGQGIDADGLKATVEAYNAAIAAGEDPEFGLPVDQAYPLTTAPYYVEKQGEYYFEVFTAVEVNDEGQVLTGDGTPVEGLLAVGQCSLGNIMTVLYGQGGTGLTFAACSGVYGARCAAQMLGM